MSNSVNSVESLEARRPNALDMVVVVVNGAVVVVVAAATENTAAVERLLTRGHRRWFTRSFVHGIEHFRYEARVKSGVHMGN